ncbi:unnamed protein product [Allacma fusca]|uniref:A-kinase anchor protein 2 C-terminal domain-containing protein n=1 Tax=Allacma fusca TaxID=39272 RepID=A0A8J2Q5H8_9HEXA|nr:unnamed protein product [Allacma fusca]
MPGEIDEESILENKPAIKNYWESKMRENSVSQFARSNFGVPSTTIIDKINDEIREDYLRNLELMNDEGLPRSSASDTSDEPIEFDSFDMASSNGSSPFGQPNHASSPLMMSESPTLIDSGHQSQESHAGLESEMEPENTSLQIEPVAHVETDGRNSFYTTGSPIYKGFRNNAGNANFNTQVPISQPTKQGQVSKVPSVGGLNYRSNVEAKPAGGRGKIENHVTHYIAFNKNFARTVKPHDELTLERGKSPPKTTATESILEEKFASLSSKPTLSEVVPRSTKSDVSYILATSRLKKEIEDNLKREKELKDQGRVKTLSVDTVSPTKSVIVAEMQFQESSKESKVKSPIVTIPEESTVMVKEEVKKPNPIAQQSIIPKKETLQPTPTKGNMPKESFQEVNPPQQSIQQIIPNFKIGKNFNSLERYIMYSSLTKLNFKSMPGTPTGNEGLSPKVTSASFDFEPNETVDSSKFNKKPLSKFPEEEPVLDDEEPVEKVRKNYIPTEKRIQNELLEMVEREEELKKSRQQWKSTPNLSNFTEEEEDVKVAVPREAAVRVNNEKRRRSALISKWEDMISKNSQ